MTPEERKQAIRERRAARRSVLDDIRERRPAPAPAPAKQVRKPARPTAERERAAADRTDCCGAPKDRVEASNKYAQRHRTADTLPCPQAKACRAAYKRARYVPSDGRDLAPCGTSAAYHRHYDRGEKPCDVCRDAKNRERRLEYQKARNGYVRVYKRPPGETRGNLNGKTAARCGTIAGAQRHYMRGEEVCEPCRLEFNRHQREAHARRVARQRARGEKKPPSKDSRCGTRNGYNRHLRRWEHACPACLEANNAYSRRLAAQRRERKRDV